MVQFSFTYAKNIDVCVLQNVFNRREFVTMLFIFSDPVSKFFRCAFLCICNRYKKSGNSSDFPSSRDEGSSDNE